MEALKDTKWSKNDEDSKILGLRGYKGKVRAERADEAIVRKAFNFLLKFFCLFLFFFSFLTFSCSK